jgi:tol-pal system protein YbgF
MKTRYLFYILSACLGLFAGCVENHSFTSLENRVAAMEMAQARQRDPSQADQMQMSLKKDIDEITQRFDNGRVMSQEEYAELKYDMQSYKESLQRLEGAIEVIQHNLENSTQKDVEDLGTRLERLDNAISKNYEKIIRLEKYMGFEPEVPRTAEETTVPVAPEVPQGQNPEQELYASAKKLLDAGDMGNARIQFENFINKYPDSDNADNARFWIADSYYTEKWFEKAILEYQKVLEDYPKSNKSAAARLKQGYAFAELGEKANARLILKELIKKFPESNEAKYAQEKLKNLN